MIGSLYPYHKARISLLEKLCEEIPVSVYRPGINYLSNDSSIRNNYKGNAWGIDMYRILKNSRITLNFHINIAGDFAINFRLYESTGVVTLLITDWKSNLDSIFKTGEEVVSYKKSDECLELINHYLENESERKKIALKGQKRTLSEYTFSHQMEKLLTQFYII